VERCAGRVELECRPIGFNRVGECADIAQRVAEVLENVRGRPPALQEKAVALDRLAGALQELERRAEVARRRGELRVQLERPPIGGRGGLMVAALAVQIAEIVVGLGAARVEREQLLVRADRLVLEAQPVVGRGEQVPALRVASLGAQQLLEQGLCRALFAPAQQFLRFSESGRAAPAGPG
jgi:hypothetical protein